MWNSLPDAVVINSSTINQFKNRLYIDIGPSRKWCITIRKN